MVAPFATSCQAISPMSRTLLLWLPSLRSMRKLVLLALAVAACSSSERAAPSPVAAGAPDPAAPLAAASWPAGPTCAPAPPVLDRPGDASCPIAKPAAPDTFDAALAAAGLDRCTLRYTAEDWSIYPATLSRDPYRLPWF